MPLARPWCSSEPFSQVNDITPRHRLLPTALPVASLIITKLHGNARASCLILINFFTDSAGSRGWDDDQDIWQVGAKQTAARTSKVDAACNAACLRGTLGDVTTANAVPPAGRLTGICHSKFAGIEECEHKKDNLNR
jgi:hypothetical protein